MIKKKTQKVTKTIEVEEEVFVLTMSREEAEVIHSLLSRVNSINQDITTTLWNQFEDIGIDTVWDTVCHWEDKPTGTIRLVKFDD